MDWAVILCLTQQSRYAEIEHVSIARISWKCGPESLVRPQRVLTEYNHWCFSLFLMMFMFKISHAVSLNAEGKLGRQRSVSLTSRLSEYLCTLVESVISMHVCMHRYAYIYLLQMSQWPIFIYNICYILSVFCKMYN